MKTIVILTALLAPSAAMAQSQTPILVYNYLPPYQPVASSSEVYIAAEARCPTSGGFAMPCGGQLSIVGLGQFARAVDVDATTARLSETFTTQLNHLAERADQGASLAGALDLVAPTNGAGNRIGAQAFTVGDRPAVGVTYTRVTGKFDLGVGVARSGDRTAGKLGVGLSW